MSLANPTAGVKACRPRLSPRVILRNGRQRYIPVIMRSPTNFIPAGARRFLHPRGKFGALRGLKRTYVGDGTTSCNSLSIFAPPRGIAASPLRRTTLPAEVARTANASPGTKAKIDLNDRSARSRRPALKASTPILDQHGLRVRATFRNRGVFAPYQSTPTDVARCRPSFVFMPVFRPLARFTPEFSTARAPSVLDQSEIAVLQETILHTLVLIWSRRSLAAASQAESIATHKTRGRIVTYITQAKPQIVPSLFRGLDTSIIIPC